MDAAEEDIAGRDAGPPQRDGVDTGSDQELRQVRDAQEAHGGSMAPGLVDATGHQVRDVPAADEDDAQLT